MDNEASWRVGLSLLAALVYADLFDYPLTEAELVKYQVGSGLSPAAIRRCLHGEPAFQREVSQIGGYYTLRGREHLVETRAQRAEDSRRIWRRARLYTGWLARMPFVRMVAVTGALAVDNIFGRPDIDLLVVAQEGRVWLCRRGLILLVRIARLFGDDLCPNFIISECSLSLDQRDFFTAHELAQMVPLMGLPLYSAMLEANGWANYYLPAAFSRSAASASETAQLSAQRMRVIEALLGSRAFDRWERWELARLRGKLWPMIGSAAEVVCSSEQCKGHVGLHRQTVMGRYVERLRQFGLDRYFSELFPDDLPQEVSA